MKKVKGFAFLVLAIGLILPLTCVNLQYVTEKYGSTDGYFYDTAKNIDVWANREFRSTWNARLVCSKIVDGKVVLEPYKFGVEGETISSALGKNQVMGTLSVEGLKLVKLLEKFEKDHCIKWIDKEKGNWKDPRTKKEGILKYWH